MAVLPATHRPGTGLAWRGEIHRPPLAEGEGQEVMWFTALATPSGRGAPDGQEGGQGPFR